MKEINKNLYYKKLAHVSVNNMVMSNTSKCSNCNNKLQEFTVFIGEDQRLSTMYLCCCSDCLSTVVNKAIKIGINNAEKQIKEAEKRLYKNSLQYVRKIKLNEINEK